MVFKLSHIIHSSPKSIKLILQAVLGPNDMLYSNIFF